jgi:3-hydroxyacyl-CoA dehydrogenase
VRRARSWSGPADPRRSDSSDAALQSAQAYIDDTLPGVLQDIVPGAQAGKLRLFTDRAQALQGAWLVTEAIPEILPAKIALLGELDGALPPDVIIATNSSSYTSSEMIERVQQRERVVNTHYYMPPRSLPVEVMPNQWTHAAIGKLLCDEARSHGLKPYLVRKESVGLIANRIWAAIKRESLYTYAEGVAEPSEIDSILEKVFGFYHGPFQGMDGVGLDVVRDIEMHYRTLRPGLPDLVIECLDEKIKQGKLGAKTGEGFYKHSKKPAADAAPSKRIVYLDIIEGKMKSVDTDGKAKKALVDGLKFMPDGVQIDSKGVAYFTNMGASAAENDGSIARVDLTKDSPEVTYIVEPGQTHTPKQIQLDEANGKLYWCDREGGRIQRCDLDGSGLETLYDAAPGEARPLQDGTKWCVGIAIDTKRGLVYWTQKGSSKGWVGRIFRASIELPSGATAEKRTDVETLFHNLPEPIDLELDFASQKLFWTDRGDPPFGNSLNSADVSAPLDASNEPKEISRENIVAERFHEAIGLALDRENKIAYVSDLLGSLWSVGFNGEGRTQLLADDGNFTGIALAPKFRRS